LENHKLPRGEGDVGFNFTDGSKVKKLYVTGMGQKQLAAGNIAIVKQGDLYEMLPRPIACATSSKPVWRFVYRSRVR
jgi:uncharacterized protein YaiL (DUF2058 family)